MRFSRDEDLYIMTHIPGPSHNYLGLRFGGADMPRLVPTGPAGVNHLEPRWVLAEVLAGVAAANERLETDYRVREVHFRVDDSRREGIYTEMARLLVCAMHADQNSVHAE